MHFCQEELLAILYCIPGATAAYLWCRNKWHVYKLKRAKIEKLEKFVCGSGTGSA